MQTAPLANAGDVDVPQVALVQDAEPVPATKIRAGQSGRKRSALPFKAGDVLAGRYAIVKKVATGGMGVVYQAIDRRRAEAGSVYPYVAVKVANIPNVNSVDARNALHREFARVAALRHEGIVNVTDFDRQGKHFFLVMEWLDGKSLGTILSAAAASGTRCFDRMLTTRFIENIADALACAHRQGVVHADIKPDNVFITEERDVKLLDFGNVSLAADRSGARYFATKAYASCEVLERKPPESSDDVFALGCIAYELLTGRRPLQGMNALEAEMGGLTVEPIEGIEPRIWRAIRAALSFRREGRPQDAGRFLELWHQQLPQALPRRRSAGGRRAMLWILLVVGVATGFGGMEIAQRPVSEQQGATAVMQEDRPFYVRGIATPETDAAQEALPATPAAEPIATPTELAAMTGAEVPVSVPAEPAVMTVAEESVAAPAEFIDVTVAEEPVVAAVEPVRQQQAVQSDPEFLDPTSQTNGVSREPGSAATLPRNDELSSGQPAQHRPGQSYWLARVKLLPAESLSSVNPIVYAAPEFPRSVRSQIAGGWVDVSFAIAPTGQAVGIEIHDAEPAGVLVREAIEAVRQWRFSGSDSGRHVRTRLQFES
ncbi:MAG: TonB family protein [Gammaproteobacteria bacterium]|nr:TonB family protein [Gammaproteobacteria bacterium]